MPYTTSSISSLPIYKYTGREGALEILSWCAAVMSVRQTHKKQCLTGVKRPILISYLTKNHKALRVRIKNHKALHVRHCFLSVYKAHTQEAEALSCIVSSTISCQNTCKAVSTHLIV